MAELMTRDEYMTWWNRIDGESIDHALPEPERTLVLHVLALQQRIDELPEELRCGCQYDHPDDVCMVHKQATPRLVHADGHHLEDV